MPHCLARSVAQALDRWRAGERTPVPCSGLLSVLGSVPDPRDARGRYSIMALLAIAILATAAGMHGYAGFATWLATASAEVLTQLA